MVKQGAQNRKGLSAVDIGLVILGCWVIAWLSGCSTGFSVGIHYHPVNSLHNEQWLVKEQGTPGFETRTRN